MLEIIDNNLINKRRLLTIPRIQSWILPIILVGILLCTAMVPMISAGKITYNNTDENALLELKGEKDHSDNGDHVIEL